jgi:hypothetical protein
MVAYIVNPKKGVSQKLIENLFLIWIFSKNPLDRFPKALKDQEFIPALKDREGPWGHNLDPIVEHVNVTQNLTRGI